MTIRSAATLIVVFLACTGPLTGQTTLGDIQGRVVNDAGAALPGVTITLASTALIRSQTVVSGEDGYYRALLLPPGTYAVTFSAPGFQIREMADVKVGIDTSVRLNVELQPAFAQEILVTTEAPLVNTSDVNVGVEVSRDFFLDLPMDRNYASIASVAPGVQDDQSGQTFYGSTGAENAYYIDGTNTTEIERGVQGMALNFEFIQEVQVKAGAYSAEYGHSTGGLVNVITRSGGNEFHGDVFGYYDSDSLRAPLSGDAAEGKVYGTSKIVGVVRSDYGADLGGYLLRDRLWFFAAYDRVDNRDTREVLDDYGLVVPGAPMGGDHLQQDVTRNLFALKLTWRPGANHSLSGSVFGDPTTEEGAFGILASPPTYHMGRQLTGGIDGALAYDGMLGDSVVLSARLARHSQRDESEGPGENLTGFFDYSDPFGTGAVAVGWDGVVSGWGGTGEEDFERQQYNADVSWFVGDLAGNHELKLGAEYEDISVVDVFTRTGPAGATVYRYNCIPDVHYCGEEGGHPYYYRHNFMTWEVMDPETITPDDVRHQRVAEIPTENFAVYLQDRWQISPNFTLDLGLRWSRQKIYSSEGLVQVDIDDNWAPRAGFVWDPLGNGRSKVFGHWGRFYESVPMLVAIAAFGGSTPSLRTHNFSDDPWDITQPPEGEAPRPAIVGIGGSNQLVDPAVRGPYMSEAVIGAEYELAQDYAIGLTYIHRSLERIVEDGMSADGEFYLGNPGEGLLTHSYTMAGYWGVPCPDGSFDCHLKQVPSPRRDFDGVELSLKKRFSNKFQFITSVMWSRLEGNFDGSYNASMWVLTPNWSPAYDFADLSVNNNGPLANDRPWQVKFDGLYRFGFGLTTGLSTYYRSGSPMTAMGYCDYPYGNWVYYLSERGVFGRSDSEWEADIHVGYPIRLGGVVELNLLLDVFNLFNRQGETQREVVYDWNYNGWEDYQPIDWDTGEQYPAIEPGDAERPPLNPSWNQPVFWQNPRIIRLGLRLSF